LPGRRIHVKRTRPQLTPTVWLETATGMGNVFMLARAAHDGVTHLTTTWSPWPTMWSFFLLAPVVGMLAIGPWDGLTTAHHTRNYRWRRPREQIALGDEDDEDAPSPIHSLIAEKQLQ